MVQVGGGTISRRANDYPHVAAAEKYCRDVVAGRINVCKWVVLACKRQINDRKREKQKNWPYRFDKAKAERICKAIELFPHVKGEWAKRKENIRLEPWQCFKLTAIFGWVAKKDGLRRFRAVYIEVPKKNAKSTETACVGLYMLACDGEEGAEIYSAATTRDQSKMVFSPAQLMARRSPGFCERWGVEVNAHNINIIGTASLFEPVSSEAKSLDGRSPHFASVDELHAHKTRDVYDIIESSMGARLQPMLWSITTAGKNRSGICYEQRIYVTKILEGVIKDERYFGIIYTIDDGDDWTDPKIWAKANPNLGVSVYSDDIARLCRKAQQLPSAQNEFLTKRLNVWVNADTAWLDMAAWDRCADPSLDLSDFEGEKCVVAFDLASKIDIAAQVQLFQRDDDYFVFCRFYLPEIAVEEADNASYKGWVLDGRLCTTPGNVIDFDVIEKDLIEIRSRFEIIEVPYDPFQATQFAVHMMSEGFPMVEFGATVRNFSEPMKQLEALVYSGKLHHDGDPVLAWMISNVVCHLDAKDNIYPRKERTENKIDGVVALIMALGRSMARGDDVRPSVYEERGILSF